MKLLFAIPHYCARTGESCAKYGSRFDGAAERGNAIAGCIASLHQLFGESQAMIQVGERKTIAANQASWYELKVIVVTTAGAHALAESGLAVDLYEQIEVDVPPLQLGFQCQRILADLGEDFDYWCYMEDDLCIRDAWWLEKLRWFNRHVGQEKLLMPNRYEVARDLEYKKCYLDGDLAPHVVSPFQDVNDEPELRSKMHGRSIRFVRPLNPHAGCYFLNTEQANHWKRQSTFAVPLSEFVGLLESAASRSIMQGFKLYKPAPENANFFEIEHYGSAFLQKVRKT